MQRRGRWVFLYLRLLLVGFGFLSAATLAASQSEWLDAHPSIRLADIPISFAGGMLGLLFVTGIQAHNPRSAKVWNKASWLANPFSLRQPCQFFHLVAWFFMASGLGILVGRLLTQRALKADALVLFAVGLGVKVGLVLAEFAFRGKFANNAS